jgi:hypothetical protein
MRARAISVSVDVQPGNVTRTENHGHYRRWLAARLDHLRFQGIDCADLCPASGDWAQRLAPDLPPNEVHDPRDVTGC